MPARHAPCLTEPLPATKQGSDVVVFALNLLSSVATSPVSDIRAGGLSLSLVWFVFVSEKGSQLCLFPRDAPQCSISPISFLEVSVQPRGKVM